MPDLLSVSQAAEIKDCHRMTIYNALDRGDLNEYRAGNTRLVVRDNAFEAWEVKVKHREKPRTDDSPNR